MAADDAPRDWSMTEEDELFWMTNLYPRDTGLPRTIWVSPKGDARHDARIKIASVPGDRMVIGDAAVMSIRPTPQLLHGELGSRERAAIETWVRLNTDILIGYWNGSTSTGELLREMRRLPE